MKRELIRKHETVKPEPREQIAITWATETEYHSKGKGIYRPHMIKITVRSDGSASFFNEDDGDSFIYLYPSQVQKLIRLLRKEALLDKL